MNKGKITISRPSFGNGKKVISITVKDVDSRVRFLDIEISLNEFSECLTGLSECECNIETRGLENVGKKIETKTVRVGLPKADSRNKELARKLADNAAGDGWAVDGYFGSQKSFYEVDGKCMAQTTAKRWV